MRRTLVVLVAALLMVPAGHAKSVVVRAGWEEARAMLAGGEYRRKIRVELQSSERAKGEFIEATDAGLRLADKGHETSFAREDISVIRLVPRKASRYKNRLLGLLIGIPTGVGAGIIASVGCCFGEETPGTANMGKVVLFGLVAAISFGFYKNGARADRGAVLVVLDESAGGSSPDPPQAEQPSQSEEQQP